MSEKTKIVVIRMKELLYSVIFTALIIILIIVLVYMFLPGNGEDSEITGSEMPTVSPQTTEEGVFTE